jgi:hypothetical protein
MTDPYGVNVGNVGDLSYVGFMEERGDCRKTIALLENIVALNGDGPVD